MDPLETLLAAASTFAPDAPEAQLWQRLDWLDRLELHLPQDQAPPCSSLVKPLQQCRAQVEACNLALYARLRRDIQNGTGGERLARLLAAWPSPADDPAGAREGFDARDELIAGVLQLAPPAAAQVCLDAEMVSYQPTPARHVLELLQRTALRADDVLVDLGAGLGHVPLLVALCSPARGLGIEIEPTYVQCAREAASALRLSRARFECCDVRDADLSAGTVFYLYTPFRGALMDRILAQLRAEAATRHIRVCSFGPCSQALQSQAWLQSSAPVQAGRVAVFDVRA